MSRDPLPQHHPWSQRLGDLGFLFALLWVAGFLCTWSGQNLLPRSFERWVLIFWLPIPPALLLAIPLGVLAYRRGYPTWERALVAALQWSLRRVVSLTVAAAPARPTQLVLGTAVTGGVLRLDSPGLHQHFLVDGKTRQGKSTLLADIAQQDVARADCAVVVLDPHASLVDTLLAAEQDRRAGERLAVLLADQDHVPGFNLLQPLAGETAADCAARLVECALALWFGGDPTEAQRFQNYAYHAAWALAATGWTVLEIEPLLRQRPFRQQVLTQVTDPRLRAWLTELDRERDDRIRDLTESTVNRFRAFAHGPAALIFGQRQTTFDLPYLLDTHGVLLAAWPTAALGETGAYLAAGVLLSLVDTLLARRPKDSPVYTNSRVRLLADEAQAYAVPPLRRLLAERAGFGASLVLSTQGLNQLADPRLGRFIVNNTSVHLVFACGAAEAHDLAEELFRPDPLRVKAQQETWTAFYSPQEQLELQAKAVQNLPPHTFFARLPGRDPVRATTRPLPVCLDGATLAATRASLARRVGRPRAEVAAELAQRQRWIYEGGSPQPAQAPGASDGWV